jgi:hypothetical protein
MCQVRRLRPEHHLVCIPVEKAVYCENCGSITNSPSECCGRCGSGSVLHLAGLIDQPPGGPGSGPASAGRIVPVLHLELAKAA